MTHDHPPHDDHPQGDTINAQDSRGFINKPSGPITQNFAVRLSVGIGVALILTFGILGASVIFNIGPLRPIAQDVWQQVFPPFEAAEEDESLIIVSDFDDRSEGQRPGYAPDQYLYDQLLDRVERDGLDVRVERLHDVLHDNNARQVGEKYNATLVLWGWYDAVGVTPRLERMKGVQQRLTDEEGQVISLADPEQIAFSVVTDLPTTGNYITLYTLGADLYATEEYGAARNYLTSAINAVPDDEAVTAQPDEAYLLRGNIAYLPPQDYPAAQRDYEAALAFSPENADTLNNLGLVAESQGNYLEAIEYHEQALALQRDLGDQQGEANSLNSLGIVAMSQGNYAEAIDYYEQSLALKRELGDRQGEATTLGNLGIVARSQGNYAEAIDYYEQALARFRELGDRQGEARTLNNLGNVAQSQGNYAEAIDYYEQALARFRELGDRQGEATTLGNLGIVARSQGNYAEASDYYEKALARFRELGDRQGVAASLNNLGNVSYQLKEYVPARDYYEQSLAIKRELGDQQGMSASLTGLGIVAARQGDYAEAIEYYEQSLTLKRELGDAAGVALTSYNLGLVYEEQGDLARAEELMQVAVDFYTAVGHAQYAELTSEGLERVQRARAEQGE
jgi:tetratricopeptide (TPR) repeat protein